ncbi:G-PROTEIN-RECEP-F1-2 domain-containing protein [Aphelenchoides fujianensis]|nr:G-PROTEIN-RECEP-F1-2 domain-containing protein [Aphelenchoides fujianensis]
MATPLPPNDPSKNTFYEAYLEDPRVIQPALVLAAILSVLVSLGTIGNLSVVYLTHRNARLKNSCNYLLALLSLSDCIHQLGHYSFIYRMATGNYFIPLRSCVFQMVIPNVAILFGVIVPTLISLDRLCSFFFPKFHQNVHPPTYVAFVGVVCCTFTASVLVPVVLNTRTDGDKLILCVVPDPIFYNPDVSIIMYVVAGVGSILAVVFYSAVWIGLHVKTGVSEMTKRTFRALTAVMASFLGGWLAAVVIHFTLLFVNAGPLGFYWSMILNGLCINFVCASNGFWLFVFSRDYRNALWRELKRKPSVVGSSVYG